MAIPCHGPICSIVILKRIRFLSVDGEISLPQILIAHAQGNAADIFDEDHDEGGPNDVPADDEEGADDLKTDLAAITCDSTAGVGQAEGSATFDGGPET